MTTQWRVQVQGQVLDRDFTTEEVQRGLAEGALPPDSMVYTPSLPGWTPVQDVAELRVGSAPSPVPPPVALMADAPPAQTSRIAGKRAGLPRSLRRLMAGAGVLAGAAALAWMLLKPGGVVRNADVTKAVVQVSAGESGGTGFFVEGPDEWAYVVTAFHVVSGGLPVSVGRAIEISNDKYYVEDYPDAEVVAYDINSDLAVIRLRNVKASNFAKMKLAAKPIKNEAVKSYGFPGRTLVRRQGLLSQEGKVLSLGKFPVIDERTGRVVRDNAIDGLLISASVEPGYSGGPTCNERGEVVGIIDMKDLSKVGHNGAISVEELPKLLAKITPVDKQVEPTAASIQDLIKRVEREYLLLPAEQRLFRRENEFIALSDVPGLRRFAVNVRRWEGSTNKQGNKLSDSARLGLYVGRQPGSPLETYRQALVKQELASCEQSAQGLMKLFEQLSPETKTGEKKLALDFVTSECDAKAVRPLAWDLTATALQWDGAERELTVAKVERVDDDQPVYHASVTPKGAATSFDVWVRQEGTDLKLKLFDDQGKPYGLFATRAVSAEALNGTWVRSSPRTAFGKTTATYQLDEVLEVSAHADGHVQARHVVTARVFSQTGTRFSLCPLSLAEGTLEQGFTGGLDGGSSILERSSLKSSTTEFEACGITTFPYGADAAMTLKVRNGKLIVYRTDGTEFPEAVEFQRR